MIATLDTTGRGEVWSDDVRQNRLQVPSFAALAKIISRGALDERNYGVSDSGDEKPQVATHEVHTRLSAVHWIEYKGQAVVQGDRWHLVCVKARPAAMSLIA